MEEIEAVSLETLLGDRHRVIEELLPAPEPSRCGVAPAALNLGLRDSVGVEAVALRSLAPGFSRAPVEVGPGAGVAVRPLRPKVLVGRRRITRATRSEETGRDERGNGDAARGHL